MRRTDSIERPETATRFASALLLAAVVALSACGAGEDLERDAATGIADRGVAPTLRASLDADIFVEAFELAAIAGRRIHHVESVLWTALTGQSNEDAHQAARSIEAEARRRDMDFALSLAVVRGASKTDLSLPPSFTGAPNFADPQVRSAFVAEAEWLARTLRPTELALAVEIETYFLERNEDYENFVSLARETYDTVKRVSPGTLVYVYFQYEELFRSFPGGEETVVANLAAMLEPFGEKLDLIGLSTYPGLISTIFPDVASLPNNYYTRIATLLDRPLFFPEIGYPASTSLIHASSEAEQAAFIARFFELTETLPVRARIWAFLHDPDLTSNPSLGFSERIFFGTSGLRRPDGSTRPAWHAWLVE